MLSSLKPLLSYGPITPHTIPYTLLSQDSSILGLEIYAENKLITMMIEVYSRCINININLSLKIYGTACKTSIIYAPTTASALAAQNERYTATESGTVAVRWLESGSNVHQHP